MAEQLQALLTATATLPPSVNPYTFLTSQLHRFAIPVQDDGKPPSYFLPLMKANYAMGACGLLFGLICLGAKAANGGIWFVRKRHTNTGTLYAPNTTLILCLINSIYFSAALASDYFVIHSFETGASLVPYKALMGPLWLSIILAVWTEAWGMMSAAHLSATSSKSWKQSIPCAFLNIVFVSGYFVTCAIILPYFAFWAHKIQVAWDALMNLEGEINAKGVLWTAGGPFVFEQSWMPDALDFATKLNIAADKIGTGFVLYAIVLLVILLLAFLPAAYGYLKMLKDQLVAYNIQAGSNQSQFSSLRNTYRMMLGESLLVFVLAIIYVLLTGWVGIWTRSVIESPINLPLILSLAYWSYSSIVTPMNALLAYRSIRPILRRRAYGRRRQADIGGITVHTTVEKHIDSPDVIGDLDDNRHPAQYNKPFNPVVRMRMSRAREPRRSQDHTVVDLEQVSKADDEKF